MLGGLALKRRWQQARRAAGLSTEKPNLILSSAVQVCWEKFCNYWDVEPRYVPITDEHKCLDGHDLELRCRGRAHELREHERAGGHEERAEDEDDLRLHHPQQCRGHERRRGAAHAGDDDYMHSWTGRR